jgi:DNA-binding NarL/FixJ family response regulator
MTEDVPLRVLVVDDHPIFRFGLAGVLDGSAAIDVVGTCADGEEAVREATRERPDVVVMDLSMPGTGGIEATRRIATASPTTAVLVLTMLDEEDSVFAAMRSGARGYLLKGATPEDTLRAVRSVARGDAVFGPGIAERMLGYFATPSGPRRSEPFPELTEREREVLGLIAADVRNAEIASRLVLSPKTVRNHVSNIFAKLHAADRDEAIAKARESGLGPRP